MKNQSLINHVAFVVDRSGSMSSLSDTVVKVFDSIIEHLSKKSQSFDQETRASVYLFDDTTDCVFYDKDVMRLPSLKSSYRVGGMTGLIDGTLLAIDELKQTAQLHGDHAFLLYILTDGMENASRATPSKLQGVLDKLPENWTVAVLVPDKNGMNYVSKVGFPQNNTMIWETTRQGMEDVGLRIREVTEQYMVARSKGTRGTKNLFKVDTSNLSSRTVSNTLDALPENKYMLAAVNTDTDIRSFVEKKVGTYVKGNTFYELTKRETVQDYKQIAVQNKISGKVWVGPEARNLLGLPNTDVKVAPEENSKFNIFVQSTSVNRKLIGGTKALVLL